MTETVPTTTDVLVIGGGPGGYVAAIRAAQLDLDVVLVERDGVGGTCLNYGCIPSKSLITATNRVDEITESQEMGIYAEPYLDVAEMIDWKDDVVTNLTDGVISLCRSNGVHLVEGTARFESESSATVTHDDGATDHIEFENAIMATGSRPVQLPGFDFSDDPVLDSRQALSLRKVPDRLVVVGAGYIGMELSTVFAKLGTAVTVLEMLDDPLPRFPSDLVSPVHDRAIDSGVDFRFGFAASHWEQDQDGVRVVAEDKNGNVEEFPAEYFVVAVGREPVTDAIGIENIDVEVDKNGFVETDDHCRTDASSIFAVGDVAGEPLLAHAASHEGLIAAETITGEDPSHGSTVPAVVFTDPEIATVGLTEQEAEEAGHDPLIGQFPFAASGRAMTTGDTEGFVKIVVDADSNRILGGQVVGPEASELIASLTIAVENGHSVSDLADITYSHPTLSEAIGESAQHALGHAIHTHNK
jgi:dihydrolipoamide dehydrogenase